MLNRRQFLTGTAGLVAAALAFDLVEEGVAFADPATYTAAWSSVDQHTAAPEWYQDAKFGIYYHFGVFSVPAYDSEWYPRNMYISGSAANVHHIATYGQPSAWPYENFINGADNLAGTFTRFAPKLKSAGGNFDPTAWAQLFVSAGAKFAGPVAEHHDGFSMWDSQVNEWNSVAKGPGLNLLQLHADAIRAAGLKLFVSMHHAYNFLGYYQYVPAQTDPSLQKLFGQLPSAQENQLWYDKLREVIDMVEPDIIYQDSFLSGVDEAQRLNFLSYYYDQAGSWGREVVATYKDGFDSHGEVYDYERGGPGDLTSPYWETDDSISPSSWCYTTGMSYYTVQQLLHSLIDRVSKNGTYLLNIAPTADGTIPQAQQNILLGIGSYLDSFGESIYATRSWTAYGEGPTKMGGGSFTTPTAGTAKDIRFTRNKAGTVLYATVLGWPGGTLTITTLNSSRINLGTLTSAQLLNSTSGSYTSLPTPTQDTAGLHITLPSSAPFSSLAYVVKLSFSGQIPSLQPLTGAVVYQDVQYSGGYGVLELGEYTASQLQLAGLPALTASSLRLAPGYQITGYSGDNFTGTSWTFTSDDPDMRQTGDNDAITSLTVQFNPAAWFRLTNVTDGLVLDSGGSVASGSNLKQWSWDGSSNLEWQAVDLGNGYYKLVNRTNGMVVDSWAATANGSPARQAPWYGNNDQQWRITHQNDGRYTIANRTTGLVLDGGGNSAVGANTGMWAWDGSTNLEWTFTKS